LVRDLQRHLICSNANIRCLLFGRNGELLVLELDEGHPPDADIADFLEALEALEDGRKIFLGRSERDVLDEQSLVRSHVLVRDQGGGSWLACARFLGGGRGVGLRLRVLLRTFQVYNMSAAQTDKADRRSVGTFLGETLALVLVEHLGRLLLDRLVAVSLRTRDLHVLAEQLEAIHLLGGIHAGLLAVEDDERLALALQAALRDDVDNGAVVLEDDGKRLLEVVDVDALLEVVDLTTLA
jgi:hypothetical protein